MMVIFFPAPLPPAGGLGTPLLTDDRLAMVRDAATQLRTDPVEIWRKTLSRDGLGGQTEDWTLFASTQSDPLLLCRVVPGTNLPNERVDEGRLELLSRFRIYLPPGTDVTHHDRLVALGATFEVIDVGAPITAEVERLVACILVES